MNHVRVELTWNQGVSRQRHVSIAVEKWSAPCGNGVRGSLVQLGKSREGKDVSRDRFYFQRLSSTRQMTWKEPFDLEKNLRPFSPPFLSSFTLSSIPSPFTLSSSLSLSLSLSLSPPIFLSFFPLLHAPRFLPRNVKMNASIIPLAFQGNVKALIKLIRSVSWQRFAWYNEHHGSKGTHADV